LLTELKGRGRETLPMYYGTFAQIFHYTGFFQEQFYKKAKFIYAKNLNVTN